MQILISRTLRWGVTIAGLTTLVGGTLYLLQHGGEALDMEKYASFSYAAQQNPATTTLDGILSGVLAANSESFIQLGVVALILTPVMRVVLSLVDFTKQKDWLYVAITLFVLMVIIANSMTES